jgi:hypothetical protein
MTFRTTPNTAIPGILPNLHKMVEAVAEGTAGDQGARAGSQVMQRFHLRAGPDSLTRGFRMLRT